MIVSITAAFFSVWLQISWWWWHWSAWNFAWQHTSVPDRFFPFAGGAPRDISKSEILVLNFGHLIAIILKTVGCMFTCQLELSKNASHRAVAAPGESIISKNVLDFFTIFASSSGINVINPLPHQWILVYHVLDAIVHRGSVVFTWPSSSVDRDFVINNVHSTLPLILIVFSRLDRVIQSVTEMLPSLG